jgi:hypothetical protein
VTGAEGVKRKSKINLERYKRGGFAGVLRGFDGGKMQK